jgi:hypothetical protein
MMSRKEACIWVTLSVGLSWALLAGMFYDWLTWAPGGSREEIGREIRHLVAVAGWVLMGIMGFAVLVMTRLMYCLLRASWDRDMDNRAGA